MRRALFGSILTGVAVFSALPYFARPAEDVPDLPELSVPGPVESAGDYAEKFRRDPLAALESALAGFRRDVASYTTTMIKRERVAGTLLPEERIDVRFREKPFSVRMDWLEGARFAKRTAYVEGANGGKVLVLGNSWRAIAGVVEREVWGDDARDSARYPITDFGISGGMARTLESWKEAREKGGCLPRVVGEDAPKELDGRPCVVVKRGPYPTLEEDGIRESTFWFDRETGAQLGSHLTGDGGALVGRYFFARLKTDAVIDDEVFTRASVGK